ncbi:MAG: hypothetical protein HOP16_18880 [Acidobacteria bacterium]|nr:hypothetical protein [Acidobacteriota bacterium]
MAGLAEALAWIQASTLGVFMRQSGPWTYALVNLAHILGISSLFGSILVLDLRLLGLWRHVPLDVLSRATVPVSQAGFAVAIVTGVSLLSSNATEYLGNPFFLIKFPAIGLGLVNVGILSRTAAWRARGQRELSRAEQRQLAMMGGVSLACWLTAISAGRMIGYW